MRLSVNLLAPQERPNAALSQRCVFLLIMFCVLFILAKYGHGLYCKNLLEEELRATTQKYQILRSSELVMTAAEDKWLKIQMRDQVLLNLSKERVSWHAVLAHLGAVVPPAIYLTEVNSGDSGVISIKGRAATSPEILKFVQLLEKDNLFSQPNILTVSQDDGVEAGARFEIIVKIKGLSP
ncbi:PilN domain-containing protein [Azotosporobacter soli]|uniref:PilN domain-containing protein n=1 Tax=Azotosporobacter soli TaxID=3055040 RepID=UPI0031FF18C0